MTVLRRRPPARRAAGLALRQAAAALAAVLLLAPLAATSALAEGGGQKRSAQLNAAFGLGFQQERPAPERPPAQPTQVIMARPGTAAWNEACAARYHSFDPATGTYLGFDGKRYRCR